MNFLGDMLLKGQGLNFDWGYSRETEEVWSTDRLRVNDGRLAEANINSDILKGAPSEFCVDVIPHRRPFQDWV